MRGPALTAAQRRAVAAAALGPLLRSAGDQLGVPTAASLAVRLTDDSELRSLNARFLHVDEPTDVLSFPAGDQAGEEGRGARVGDVAISVERAMRQAGDPIAELRLLAVHGLLHCLGHDHAHPAQASRMTAATRRLLPGEPVPDL